MWTGLAGTTASAEPTFAPCMAAQPRATGPSRVLRSRNGMRMANRLCFATSLMLLAASLAVAQSDSLAPGSAALVSPEEVLKVLQSPKGDKPLILNVGPYLLS